MNILLTNDDGIHAPGLWAIYEQIAGKHCVTVIAPDRERSAVSHGVTLHETLRVRRFRGEQGYAGYAVNGTPADCVKLGLTELLDTRPDMVISGINPGSNVGVSVNYSGTVAGAREAALYGIPAVAVSLNGYEGMYYEDAAAVTALLIKKVYEKGLPFGTLLNVNIPDMPKEKMAGLRITRQEVAVLSEHFEKRIDPRNGEYYWLGEDRRTFGRNPDMDGDALGQNYVSVTPIQCDATDYRTLEELRVWNTDISGLFLPTS